MAWSNEWKNSGKAGYKRPPQHSKFRAGQSGNPKGRPRHRKGNRQLLEDALNTVCTVTEGGVAKVMSHKQLIYKVLVANAVKGNARASAQLFKLMQDYGMMESVDIATRKMIVRFVSPNSDKEYGVPGLDNDEG